MSKYQDKPIKKVNLKSGFSEFCTLEEAQADIATNFDIKSYAAHVIYNFGRVSTFDFGYELRREVKPSLEEQGRL